MLSTTSTVVRSYGFAGIRDQNTLWTIQTAHGVQSPVARELSCRRTEEQHVMGRVVNQPLTCHSQSRNAFLVCVCGDQVVNCYPLRSFMYTTCS
jgi:hypothetical protein